MKRIFSLILVCAALLSFGVCFAAAAESGDEFDIETAHIGVMTGSTGEAYATKAYPNATLESYGDIMDAVAALSAGKLTAVITSDVSAINIVDKNSALMIDSDKLTDESVSICVRKTDDARLEQFNSVIEELESDGTLADMRERWMGGLSSTPVEIPEVSGPVLKVGLTATRAPFSYKASTGEIIGFAPELAYRAAQKLGYRIDFVVVEFSALIPALQSGKIDAIIDLLVYTEERGQRVNFSTEYYKSGQVILRVNPDFKDDDAGFFAKLKNSVQDNFLTGNRWKLIIDGLLTTMLISFCAFILATVFGFVLCFFNMGRNKLLRAFSKIYLSIFRGTPIVVLLMITYYIIFAKSSISPVGAAIIAFGFNSAAAISVILGASIATVSKGQIQAARSMGFGRAATFLYITLPQAVKVGFPTYKSEFISLFKGTAIVGYIAIVDLTKAGDFIRSQTFDAFFPLILVAVVYFIIITIIVRGFDQIFKLTDKRSRRDREC